VQAAVLRDEVDVGHHDEGADLAPDAHGEIEAPTTPEADAAPATRGGLVDDEEKQAQLDRLYRWELHSVPTSTAEAEDLVRQLKRDLEAQSFHPENIQTGPPDIS